MVVDAHTHLDLPEFDSDREEVIERARQAGLVAIITVGIDMESCKAALEIAQKHDFIYCSLGAHPHEAQTWSRSALDALRGMLDHPKAVAVGETGLDFYRNRSPRDDQERAFRDHIRLAVEKNLPVVVHDRDAHDETVEILSQERADRVGGVIHCFSGDTAMARSCLDMGFFISIPGIITFPKAEQIKEVARFVPLDRLLVETDAPFLAPVPRRGKRNESSFVVYTLEELARVKSAPVDQVAEITTQNAFSVFGLPQSLLHPNA